MASHGVLPALLPKLYSPTRGEAGGKECHDDEERPFLFAAVWPLGKDIFVYRTRGLGVAVPSEFAAAFACARFAERSSRWCDYHLVAFFPFLILKKYNFKF